MTLEQFIKNNREELTNYIRNAVPNNPDIDDDEIESWINNDASLYAFAVHSGVDL